MTCAYSFRGGRKEHPVEPNDKIQLLTTETEQIDSGSLVTKKFSDLNLNSGALTKESPCAVAKSREKFWSMPAPIRETFDSTNIEERKNSLNEAGKQNSSIDEPGQLIGEGYFDSLREDPSLLMLDVMIRKPPTALPSGECADTEEEQSPRFIRAYDMAQIIMGKGMGNRPNSLNNIDIEQRDASFGEPSAAVGYAHDSQAHLTEDCAIGNESENLFWPKPLNLESCDDDTQREEKKLAFNDGPSSWGEAKPASKTVEGVSGDANSIEGGQRVRYRPGKRSLNEGVKSCMARSNDFKSAGDAQSKPGSVVGLCCGIRSSEPVVSVARSVGPQMERSMNAENTTETKSSPFGAVSQLIQQSSNNRPTDPQLGVRRPRRRRPRRSLRQMTQAAGVKNDGVSSSQTTNNETNVGFTSNVDP